MASPIKIIPTGKYQFYPEGRIEIFEIEPYYCSNCSTLISEYAGEYTGKKAAKFAAQQISRQDYKCLCCLEAFSKQKAKRLL